MRRELDDTLVWFALVENSAMPLPGGIDGRFCSASLPTVVHAVNAVIDASTRIFNSLNSIFESGWRGFGAVCVWIAFRGFAPPGFSPGNHQATALLAHYEKDVAPPNCCGSYLSRM